MFTVVSYIVNGDYIWCEGVYIYQVIISSVYIEESNSTTEYSSRML